MLALRPVEDAVVCSYTGTGKQERNADAWHAVQERNADVWHAAEATPLVRWALWEDLHCQLRCVRGSSHTVYIEQVKHLLDFLVDLFERNLAGLRDSGHLRPARQPHRCHARRTCWPFV